MSKEVKIEKNQVLSYPCDFYGCGHYRIIFPFNYLNSVAGPTAGLTFNMGTNWLGDGSLLALQRSIVFQRMCNPTFIPRVETYFKFKEKLKYKMIYEIDDDIWNIPLYNKAHEVFNEIWQNTAVKIIKLCDTVTVTNDRLKRMVHDKSKFPLENIKVIPNFIPDYLAPKTFKKKTTIPKIPRVLYAGGSGHFSNEGFVTGDFPQELVNYLISAVENDEIQLHILGTRPYFLDSVKDKIQFHEWVGMYDYYNKIREIDPNFCIAPLQPNIFNQSKSDLKYRECSALNIFFIGTTFRGHDFDGPYDNSQITLPWEATEDDYRNLIKEYKNIHKYNEVIQKQFDQAVEEKYWLSDNSKLLIETYAK